MWKLLVIFALLLPSLTQAVVFPNGKIFEERTAIYYALSGVPVVVSEWVEVPLNTMKYVANNLIPIAKAKDFNLQDEIEIWIKAYASVYKVSEEELIALAQCESGMNPEAFNPKDPKGGAYGLYQYLKPTFLKFAKESKIKNLEYKNWKSQAELTAWAWDKGLQNHWKNCYYFIRFGKWK